MPCTAPLLLTGAGQRLGLHCAHRLLDEGQPIIFGYRSERSGVTELRQRGAIAIACDLSQPSGIEHFIQQVHEQTDQLRGIIHNASDWLDEDPRDPIGSFQTLTNLHMLAPYLINLRCEGLLRKSAKADIIHIGDDVTRRGSSEHAAYSASKAGAENLALSFAQRFAPQIKVNSIAPALILFNPDDDAEYRQRALNKSLLGIEPGAEVFYQSIRYLLDTPYVTGTRLVLNGGRHLKS